MKRLFFAGLVVVSLIFGLTRFFRSEPADEIRLTGVVSANEAIVSSEIPGRIEQLLVNEGDAVRKGQVVAVLVADELDTQRASKKATIDQYKAKVEQGEEQVRLERARVASQIDGAKAQVKALESQRLEIVAELEQTKSELERTNELVDQGLVARQRQDRQETAVQVAESRLKATEDRIEAAAAEVEVYRASERQIRVAEQEVQQTKAQRAQAQAELDQIEVRLGHTELKSPLTGIVSVRAAREGEFVAAGTPVVTVVDLNDTWVRAQVEETYVSSILLGQELKVRLASDEELPGKVTFISPEAEFATQRDVDRVKRDIRTFALKVAVPNPDGRIHPGMTVFVLVPREGGNAAAAEASRTTSLETEAPDNHGGLVPEASAAPVKPGVRESTTPQPSVAAAAPPRPVAPVKTVVPGATVPNAAEHAPRGVAAPKTAGEARASRPETRPSTPLDAQPGTAPQPDARHSGPPALVAPVVKETPQLPESKGPAAAELENARSSPATTKLPPRGPLPPSIEDLVDKVESDDATDRDMALLEARLAEELGEENVNPPEPAPAPAPASASPRAKSPAPADGPAASPCADSKDCHVAAPPTAPPPAFRLEGTSVVEGKPAAIINGTRVFEGQAIDEARVLRIQEGSVQLEYRGRVITLRF